MDITPFASSQSRHRVIPVLTTYSGVRKVLSPKASDRVVDGEETAAH